MASMLISSPNSEETSRNKKYKVPEVALMNVVNRNLLISAEVCTSREGPVAARFSQASSASITFTVPQKGYAKTGSKKMLLLSGLKVT